ncbi:MAG: ankyrin repeat domain-containing protein [Saprospiraceae bacterium]|nr:ankyrin repeat domain-containing protein [Saprospiraceae bacterium]
MKYQLLTFLLLISFFAEAQGQNIFHDRSFWKTAPNIEQVQEKINAGHDAEALNPNAFDATVYAILENAPLKTIEFLLSMEGNDVNKMTHDGRHYLLWAAYKGNLPLMKHLIKEGSQIDLVDDHGYGLMTFAANAGQKNTEVYDLIIASGGKAKETNRSGATALLLLAPHLQDDQLINYFQSKGLSIHDKDKDGNGMFQYASRRGNLKLMKQLVEQGVDYKSIDKKGRNAMLFATYGSRGYQNPIEVYQYLAELGLQIDIVDWEGRTPLHNLAGSNKDAGIIEFFLKNGVNVNQVDESGNTAFLNAIRGNNVALAEKLGPMVSDFNHSNHDGYSALTYAIMRNSIPAFKFLLTKGADLEVIDKKGNNLAYHVFQSFRQQNKDAFEHFVKVAKEHDLKFTDSFEKGNTLAHVAITKEDKFLLEKALEMGIEINQKNDDGLTPLHLAAMKAKNEELLSFLLEQGADKKILTTFEESAFDLANENEALSKEGTDLGFLKIK